MAKNKQNHFKGKTPKDNQAKKNEPTDTVERRDSIAKKLYGRPFQQLTPQQKAIITTSIGRQDKKYY